MDIGRRINLLRIVRTVSIACFFLLSSVVPSTVLAAGGVIATNNCHVLDGLYGTPRPTGDASVKTYGVTRDANSYYTKYKDQAVAAFKAAVEDYVRRVGGYDYCLPIVVTPRSDPYRGGPQATDLLQDNTVVVVSPFTSPGWMATYESSNPVCNPFWTGATEILSVQSLSAPLQKVNQPFHQFSDESVDLINATCLGQQQYTIKLSNDINPPASGDLAEVEPGKATTTLRATV